MTLPDWWPAMYQEQVLRYKHLDEGRLVFECILAGNFQTFFTCNWPLPCSGGHTLQIIATLRTSW